jgi:hypothetical protein
MSQQETATDRLVPIIKSIQLGRLSGILTARRGEGMIEEGTIAFVNGQVTQAHVGRRSGSGALNWLSTWGRCLFSFVPSDPLTITPPSLPSSPGAREDHHKDNGSYPRIQDSTSDKPSGPPERPSGLLLPGSQNGATAGQPTQPARIAIVPSPTQPLSEALSRIEQRGLSRIHKHVFLLIDGHRSVMELGRLSKKNQDEVYGLLRDLVRLGVIRIGEK